MHSSFFASHHNLRHEYIAASRIESTWMRLCVCACRPLLVDISACRLNRLGSNHWTSFNTQFSPPPPSLSLPRSISLSLDFSLSLSLSAFLPLLSPLPPVPFLQFSLSFRIHDIYILCKYRCMWGTLLLMRYAQPIRLFCCNILFLLGRIAIDFIIMLNGEHWKMHEPPTTYRYQ